MPALDYLQSLLGFKPEKPQTQMPAFMPAPPRKQYPTQEEAQFAQKQDYSYGQSSAPYATGQQARILTGDWNTTPYPATNVRAESAHKSTNVHAEAAQKYNQMPDHVRKALDNFYMRALLAVEGSSL